MLGTLRFNIKYCAQATFLCEVINSVTSIWPLDNCSADQRLALSFLKVCFLEIIIATKINYICVINFINKENTRRFIMFAKNMLFE